MCPLGCIWTSVFCLNALSLIKPTSDIRHAETVQTDGENAPPSAAAYFKAHSTPFLAEAAKEMLVYRRRDEGLVLRVVPTPRSEEVLGAAVLLDLTV